MYGAQACRNFPKLLHWFENDVEMYGAQANFFVHFAQLLFENDVEMYGAQAFVLTTEPL